jgi:hypothetical protein
LGKNYYIAIFPLFAMGGNLLYSHFSAYPGKGENGYIFPGEKMAMGGKWLYNTVYT